MFWEVVGMWPRRERGSLKKKSLEDPRVSVLTKVNKENHKKLDQSQKFFDLHFGEFPKCEKMVG